MDTPPMRIDARCVGPFQENSYLLVDGATNRSVMVDPGDEGDELLAMLEASRSALEAIWVTHGHLDHVGGIAAIKRRHDVPVFLHPADLVLYGPGAIQAARRYGVPFDPPPPPDRTLAEGDRLTLGTLAFDAWHVPGHAPGHVIIHGHGIAFGGDCLFAGSIGRTDLPLSDGAAMQQSLARIATLPPATVVYPGHGPTTTIGEELATNPFLTGLARPVRR